MLNSKSSTTLEFFEPHVTPFGSPALTGDMLDDQNMPVRPEMASIGSGAVLPEKLRQLLVELGAGHDKVSPGLLGRFPQL